jgi:invasion protein IalB
MTNFFLNLTKISSSLIKNVLFILFLIFPTTTSAEITTQKWNKVCNKENKNCIIGIKKEVKIANSDKKQNLATILLQLVSKTERSMNLVDEKDKTYKLSETDKLIPLLSVRLPLNTSLKNNPLIRIDNKSIANLNFTHCNNQTGCTAIVQLNNEAIKFFEAGNEITVIMKKYSDTKQFAIAFPLKGFTKSYKDLNK